MPRARSLPPALSREELDEFRPGLEAAIHGRASVTTALPTMLEVLPLNASKREGVLAYCAHLGLTEAELAAIGDGENDAEMLRNAALGFAMGNAGRAAREAADCLVGTNDEAGASTAIRIVAALAQARQGQPPG